MANKADVAAKIASFTRLSVGWDYGRGGPCSSIATLGATGLLRLFSAAVVTAFDAAPGQDGAVTLVAARLGREAEISCLPSGRYNLTFFAGGDVDIVDDCSPTQVIDLLRGQGWLTAISSTSCIHGGTYQISAGTRAKHLRTAVTEAEYRLFAPIVSIGLKNRSVSIYESSATNEWPELHPSFGDCDGPIYQPMLC